MKQDPVALQQLLCFKAGMTLLQLIYDHHVHVSLHQQCLCHSGGTQAKLKTRFNMNMQVINESLRMWSVIAIGNFRRTEEPLELDGYDVPAGTSIVVPIHAMHMSADNFEEAHAFHPERWLPSDCEQPPAGCAVSNLHACLAFAGQRTMSSQA